MFSGPPMITSPSEFEQPVPPSRQWIALPERNFTQASCISCQVERSVAIGFSSELPLKGKEKNRDGLESLLSVACSTSCWLCCRLKSVHDGSSWFSRTREKISASCPFRCVGPLWKRQPFHWRQRCCEWYGQSNRFERMFSGTFTVIPPTASMSFSNWLKWRITTWLIGKDVPRSLSSVWIASFGPPSCIAALIFSWPWPG